LRLVAVLRPSTFLLVVLVALAPVRADAGERTYIFTPADLVRAVDEFNANLIANSKAFRGAVKVNQGSVALMGARCPSLATDPQRMLTRVRVLDGPARAALMARRPRIGQVLGALGAATWAGDGAASTHQPLWLADPVTTGMTGFVTEGFPNDDAGALVYDGAHGDRSPNFMVKVRDVVLPALQPVTAPSELVLAITTEVPPTKAHRRPKRTECYLLGASYPVDPEALIDMLQATPLDKPVRDSLLRRVAAGQHRLIHGANDRGVLLLKRFAIEIALRSAIDVSPDLAEAMTTRTIDVLETLELGL
jgi:hypothetical protein